MKAICILTMLILLILLLASMSSCISKNSYREGEDGYTITVEEYMRKNPKIIAKYGDKFKLYEKSSGEGGELDYAGLSGSSRSTVSINDMETYSVEPFDTVKPQLVQYLTNEKKGEAFKNAVEGLKKIYKVEMLVPEETASEDTTSEDKK